MMNGCLFLHKRAEKREKQFKKDHCQYKIFKEDNFLLTNSIDRIRIVIFTKKVFHEGCNLKLKTQGGAYDICFCV